MLKRWHALQPRALDALAKLKNDIALFKDFEEAHSSAVVNLSKVDGELTELQHLQQDENPKARLGQLQKLEAELNKQNETMENADKLGLLIMKKSDKKK